MISNIYITLYNIHCASTLYCTIHVIQFIVNLQILYNAKQFVLS